MPLFIMATRLIEKKAYPSEHLKEKEKKKWKLRHIIRSAGLEVEWIASYEIKGSYDYMDVIHVPDEEIAIKASGLLEASGHAQTEIWDAFEWPQLGKIMAEIPKAA